jgi:murein L,D-transpeptidase YcbB/YkuD
MFRNTSLAACIGLAAALAVVAAGPAGAQSAPDGAAVEQREAPAVAADQQEAQTPAADAADQQEAQAPAADKAAAAAPPAETAAPATADAATVPAAGSADSAAAPAAGVAANSADSVAAAVEVDPVIVEVRQRLGALRHADATAPERAALTAFYADRKAPVWVTTTGFTDRARHAMAEIAQADDWGLEAKAFALPQLAAGDAAPAALADAEIRLSVAVLKYARYARGGRLEPSQVSRNFDQKLSLRDPKVVLETAAGLETPGSYLRALHPRHPQFELLRQALIKTRAGSGDREAEAVVRLPAGGPVLKLGVEHPDVALLRKRFKLGVASGAENLFDEPVREAVKAYQRNNSMRDDGVVGAATRAALNGTDRPNVFGTDEQRLIVNMERWRWMPEDMGELYVWDNIPEFQTRVVKNGRVIHQARIIVGRVATQTTIFSANMRNIVFGPEWGVPDSIKVKELLPYLRPSYEPGLFGFGGSSVTDTRILDRQNMRVVYNGRQVDASQIDWSQVDIRKYSFIQAAGPGNALGAVKFNFPNKHDIYMHDTPLRDLFNRPVRTFSHGCMRVQNPGRFAEILLEEDKGWPAAKVRELLERGGSNEVPLSKHIPVHITYFTTVASEDGKVTSLPDIYGHDRRVAAALAGRPIPLEPAQSLAVAQEQAPASKKEARRPRYEKQAQEDLFSGLFGN